MNCTRCGALGAVVLGLTLGAPVAAHETDQFTVPQGKMFADIGPELSKIYYKGIDAAVRNLNGRISHALAKDRGPSYIAYLQSPETLTTNVYDEYAAAWFMIQGVESMVHTDRAMKAKHPGRMVGYWESIHNIFTGVYFPLDPRQLFRLFHACTMKAYGVYIGPDKLGHFTDMGFVYYSIYRDAIASGDTETRAYEKVVAEGSGGLVLGEQGMLGYLSAGVYSNADLAANYSGLKFYLNLTREMRIGGVWCPPMIVRQGDFWAIRPHVRRDSDFFARFVSDHWNEAFNPGLFEPGMQSKVRRNVKMRSQRVLDFYKDDNGNRRPKRYFDALLEEHLTWYGEEYGHRGTTENMITISNTCFGDPPADGGRNLIGYTALHWAVVHDDRALAIEALDDGAPVDETVRSLEPESAEWGSTSLHLAAANGRMAMAEFLLEHGADVNSLNEQGASPLHRAVAHPRIVVLLIEAGGDVNATDERGRTPLHWATRYNDRHTAELLLEHGAHVGAADHAGETALHRAAHWGHPEMIEVLLSAGADINARARFDTTPVHFAVRQPDAAIVRLLATRGANVDAIDEFGVTPLHDAARAGKVELTKALLSAGADVDAADHYGSTPLHLAARYDHEAVVGELLANGVNVNLANDFGSLPLHEAAFANRTSLINLLLASGADTSARDGNGESPIDLASAEGNSVAVLIMKSSSFPGRHTVAPRGIQ